MIGRILKPGDSVAGLLRYLFGPGRANEHVNPHVVAAWRPDPSRLEPSPGPSGRPDVSWLAELLEQPLALLGSRCPDKPVFHFTARTAPGDPELTDEDWAEIMAEVMHRTGLSQRGLEHVGVRWVAVRHADDHVHLVATLARQDGGRARLSYERRRVREAMHWAERKYGLQVTGYADRTAPSRPSRAEWEKSRRAGRTIPPRVALRRKVEAAVAAGSDAEFFAGLEARGAQVRLRYSTIDPAAVTGYAVGLPGDLSKAGTQVWFSGGKLAPDLTLPRLRHRWDPSTSAMPARVDVREIYAQATAAAQLAAQEIKAGKRGASHTIWAAADLLTAAADATGNHELQVSADFFRRAALEPWGRIPRPSPTGQMVRASARFLAATRRGCPVAACQTR